MSGQLLRLPARWRMRQRFLTRGSGIAHLDHDSEQQTLAPGTIEVGALRYLLTPSTHGA